MLKVKPPPSKDKKKGKPAEEDAKEANDNKEAMETFEVRFWCVFCTPGFLIRMGEKKLNTIARWNG